MKLKYMVSIILLCAMHNVLAVNCHNFCKSKGYVAGTVKDTCAKGAIRDKHCICIPDPKKGRPHQSEAQCKAACARARDDYAWDRRTQTCQCKAKDAELQQFIAQQNSQPVPISPSSNRGNSGDLRMD